MIEDQHRAIYYQNIIFQSSVLCMFCRFLGNCLNPCTNCYTLEVSFFSYTTGSPHSSPAPYTEEGCIDLYLYCIILYMYLVCRSLPNYLVCLGILTTIGLLPCSLLLSSHLINHPSQLSSYLHSIPAAWLTCLCIVYV